MQIYYTEYKTKYGKHLKLLARNSVVMIVFELCIFQIANKLILIIKSIKLH